MGRLSAILSIGLIASAALAAAPAAASEESIRLSAKALVELERGQSITAGNLADRAVQADPGDPYAYYYQGVIRGRRGDLEGAIAALRQALALQPDLAEAQLDLGVALVQSGDYAAAKPLLEAARRHPDLQGNATLFLGIAQLRSGALEESLVDFRTAAAVAPNLAVVSRYYQGVAQERLGRVDEARLSFRAVVAADPQSEVGREAVNYLAALDRGVGGAQRARRYRIYGGIGLDYDSNVTLETDDQPPSNDNEAKSDVNGNLHLGGRYSLWRGENTAVSAGYEFFQRLYVSRNDANLQGHRPSLSFTALWQFLRFGLVGRYEFYLLQTSKYLQRGEGLPWIAFVEGEWGRSELSYRVRWSDFFDTPPGTSTVAGIDDDQALDSLSHQPRLRQYFYILDPRRYVSIGYAYERRDALKSAGDPFAYDAHEVEVAGGTPLFWEVSLDALYSYRRENYDEDGRLDQPHRIVAVLRRPLAEWLEASVGYYGTIQESNRFPYDRHIVSVGLDFAF